MSGTGGGSYSRGLQIAAVCIRLVDRPMIVTFRLLWQAVIKRTDSTASAAPQPDILYLPNMSDIARG